APVTQGTGLAAALRSPDGGDHRLVDTLEALADLAAQLRAQPEFALDTETTGQRPMDCDVCGISFAWEVGRGYYVPLRCVYGGGVPLELVKTQLGPVLADPTKRKIGQNLKFDLNVLRNAGLPVAGPLFDTMVASFVLDPLRGSHKLNSLALNLLGHTMIPIADLIGRGRDQLRMDQVPLARIAEYAAEDADYTWRLSRLFEPQLAPLGLERLFYEVEMPLLRVLTDMEAEGIRIDVDFLRQMGQRMAEQTAALAQRVHDLVGAPFNLDSPKQLAEVLFDRLCLPVIRRTKTTRSTDADTLEELRRQTNNPVCDLLLQYRELQKLRGTYVDALPQEISRRTGRVHTCFHQTAAVTGRLSSSEPNLQNIPIRTDVGREIRRAFVPRTPDDVLIVADYSQVELRIMAHFSGDEALLRAFAEDRDIHAFVAAEVNGVPLEAVTREQRSRAKAVNFGIIYGQSAFGLAQQTGMSRGDAQQFISAYFARYRRVRAFIDACIADARLRGFVRTILGRRRPIENINSRTNTLRAQAERFAVNTVIQGSAADLIKLAMIRLHARIRDERLPLRMLLQVHDELVCEAPRAAAPQLVPVVREVMTSALPDLRVPLKVDVASGESWLEAK
ncbi:MAG: DNA polymerase I, partial [Planctomycetota bacterium]